MLQAMLTDALGYVAAGLVFATFCAQRMTSLRSLAIASNVAFIGYGFLDGLWPILIVHSAMLPINVQRYRQCVRGRCATTAVHPAAPAPSGSTLLINTVLGWLRSWRERAVLAGLAATRVAGKVGRRPRLYESQARGMVVANDLVSVSSPTTGS